MPQSSPRSRILENFNGSQEENFSGYAARIPVCAKKTRTFCLDFIDYTKNTIFTSTYVTTYGSSYISFLDTLKYHPRYHYNASIQHKNYERKYLYGSFIGSAINSDSILWTKFWNSSDFVVRFGCWLAYIFIVNSVLPAKIKSWFMWSESRQGVGE